MGEVMSSCRAWCSVAGCHSTAARASGVARAVSAAAAPRMRRRENETDGGRDDVMCCNKYENDSHFSASAALSRLSRRRPTVLLHRRTKCIVHSVLVAFGVTKNGQCDQNSAAAIVSTDTRPILFRVSIHPTSLSGGWRCGRNVRWRRCIDRFFQRDILRFTWLAISVSV